VHCVSNALAAVRHYDAGIASGKRHVRAWKVGERLRATGLPVCLDGAPLDLAAEVLAEIQGDSMRLLECEPVRRV
jgi:hypothetical protein